MAVCSAACYVIMKLHHCAFIHLSFESLASLLHHHIVCFACLPTKMIKMVKTMPVLAGQREQVSVYENMSHFAPENKNVYFGTKKMKPVLRASILTLH